MFTDNVEIILSSGKGGAGAVAFRREKFVIKGGPNGGDGGRGGDVYFLVDKNSHTLSNFKGKNHLKADNGMPGGGSNMTGKSGEKLIVKVPPGTQVVDVETEEVLFDLVEDGQKEKFLQGGKGGLGNTHFKSSTNQRPSYAQPGMPGATKKVRLELKLIADVGLVGFPNVGKSTLISTVSNAKPEIANYEFTTLTPKLGEVVVDDYSAFVMADIPGIIGGASEGKGLGIQFLKHIERTKTLLFMIDLGSYMEMPYQYDTLRQEIQSFSEKLAGRNFAIALTRSDIFTPDDVMEKAKAFLEHLGLETQTSSKYQFDESLGCFVQEEDNIDTTKPLFVAPISSATRTNIKPLIFALSAMVRKEQ